jgi:hypothetical protein
MREARQATPAIHDRACGNEVLSKQIFERVSGSCSRRNWEHSAHVLPGETSTVRTCREDFPCLRSRLTGMKVGFVLTSAREQHPIGVRVKEVDLSLELIRAAPIVVPFKKRQIVAAASCNCLREIPHGADVPFPEKNHDLVGLAPLEIQNHCPSPVRGAILADDDFIVKIDLWASTLSIACPMNRS